VIDIAHHSNFVTAFSGTFLQFLTGPIALPGSKNASSLDSRTWYFSVITHEITLLPSTKFGCNEMN
jgi:hypothetical protein